MNKLFSRLSVGQKLQQVFNNPALIKNNLPDPVLPVPLANWLSRLSLLHGVPFNYLVPDEKMLPPESIRFFYLDANWTSAVVDGAFSIGRNLTNDASNFSLNVDKAVQPGVMETVKNHVPVHRSRLFGMPGGDAPALITGFLLRSSVVLENPDLGVYAFPTNEPANALDILRLEIMGPGSDTLICLVSGDAVRIDIHQPTQALHYGIDCYNFNCVVNTTPVLAMKKLHHFTSSGTKVRTVTMSKDGTPTDISGSIRKNTRRVIDMDALAGIIATSNSRPSIDAAEMGFEMTEGVGMVSFYKNS